MDLIYQLICEGMVATFCQFSGACTLISCDMCVFS